MENTQNVFVAAPKAGGAVWSAPAGGKNVPTDAISDLAPEYEGHGFISEDGIANQVETDTNDLKAYGGKVVKTVQTSRKETFTFTPIETNARTLKDQYGDDNVTIDEKGNICALHNAKTRPARTFVFETVLDENKVQRDVVPFGRITEVGEKKFADGEAIASQLTISCEEDTAGNTAYTYIAEIVDEPTDNTDLTGGTGEEVTDGE